MALSVFFCTTKHFQDDKLRLQFERLPWLGLLGRTSNADRVWSPGHPSAGESAKS